MKFLKRMAWAVPSLLLYVISLFLPGLYGGDSHLVGWVLLILGIFGMANAVSFAWLANGLFALAWVVYAAGYLRIAIIMSLLAFFVGLDTFRVEAFPLDEGGMEVARQAFGEGFYAWELSFLAFAASIAYQMWKARQERQSQLWGPTT